MYPILCSKQIELTKLFAYPGNKKGKIMKFKLVFIKFELQSGVIKNSCSISKTNLYTDMLTKENVVWHRQKKSELQSICSRILLSIRSKNFVDQVYRTCNLMKSSVSTPGYAIISNYQHIRNTWCKSFGTKTNCIVNMYLKTVKQFSLSNVWLQRYDFF